MSEFPLVWQHFQEFILKSLGLVGHVGDDDAQEQHFLEGLGEECEETGLFAGVGVGLGDGGHLSTGVLLAADVGKCLLCLRFQSFQCLPSWALGMKNVSNRKSAEGRAAAQNIQRHAI